MTDEHLAQLLAAYEDGVLDAAGKDELVAWIGDDATRREVVLGRLRGARHLRAALAPARGLPELGRRCLALAAGARPSRRAQLVGRVRQHLHPRRRRRSRAVALLVVALTLLAVLLLPTREHGDGTRVGTWVSSTGSLRGSAEEGAAARIGDRLDGRGTASLVLADGSRLDFTGDLAVALTAADRIHLRRGRCLATVRTRPERPLVLSTPQLQVAVLGTRFDLASGAWGAQLWLHEGRVMLADSDNRLLETLDRPGARAVDADGHLLVGIPADSSWRSVGAAPLVPAPGHVDTIIAADAATSSGWRGSGLFTAQAFDSEETALVLSARLLVEEGAGRHGVMLSATPELDPDAEGQPSTFQRLELFTDQSGVLIQRGDHTRRERHPAGSLLEAGRWYSLAVAIDSEHFTAWLDGERLLTMPNALSGQPHVHLGFRAATKEPADTLQVRWRDAVLWQRASHRP